MLVCISIELLQPSFQLVHQYSFLWYREVTSAVTLSNPENSQTLITLTTCLQSGGQGHWFKAQPQTICSNGSTQQQTTASRSAQQADE